MTNGDFGLSSAWMKSSGRCIYPVALLALFLYYDFLLEI